MNIDMILKKVFPHLHPQVMKKKQRYVIENNKKIFVERLKPKLDLGSPLLAVKILNKS